MNTDDLFKTGGAGELLATISPTDADLLIGREFGDYRITVLLGEGGMGRVYRAQRTDGQFERDVAIKVSTASSISSDFKSRFLREQQILANMTHNNVAKLFDAGTTDEGWSYFVLELIDGSDISEYVVTHSLSNSDILRLILPVLDALAFAHARLVVHRDIKPSNVIIDERGQPKLLDFGIAKLLDDEAAEMTEMRPLTVSNASPEQLLGQPITIASDIYQVGLLLHQLMLGRLPHDDRNLASAIRDASQSASFQLDANARGGLHPDLIAVVTHCLDNDPSQRYRDINALADDLRRHLANRPVSVRSPSALSRLIRLVQRNKLVSGVTSLLLITLIGGASIYTWQINQARGNAELEAATSQQVVNFLTDIFEGSDPANSRGDALTARELLDRGAADLEGRFIDRPIIKSRLYEVIGGVYREMGLFEQALPLNEAALTLRTEFLGPLHRQTLVSGNDLAIVYERLGEFRKSEATYLDVLAKQREILGSDDVYTLKTINNLGSLYFQLSDHEQAAAYWEEAYERRKRVLGVEHEEYISTLSNLPIPYIMMGQLDRAQVLFVEALDVSRNLRGEMHPGTINAIHNVGMMYIDRAMYEEALPYNLEAWAKSQQIHEPSHQASLYSGASLASNYLLLDEVSPDPAYFESAEQILAKVADAGHAAYPPTHPITLTIDDVLASLENRQGKHTEAMQRYLNILSRQLTLFSPDNDQVLLTRVGIADTHFKLGQLEVAVRKYEELLPLAKEVFGEFHPEYLDILLGLAEAHAANGDHEIATHLFQKAVDSYVETLGQDDPRTLAAIKRQEST